jgi:amino acid adenylation domain-containing protein
MQTKAGYNMTDLQHRILHRTQERPDAIALVQTSEGGDSEHWSYAALLHRAQTLANGLVELGVGPETRVAIALPRSVAQVETVLAVLVAGGAFCPLEPGLPAQRWRALVEDLAASGPLLLVRGPLPYPAAPPLGVRTTTLATLGAGDARDARPWALPTQLAYVLFTSGSTGRPKGVMVGRDSLSRLLATYAAALELGPADRVAHNLAPGFDASLLEALLPLTVGATVLVGPRPAPLVGDELATWLERHGASLIFAPPSMLAGLDPARLGGLRHLVSGGEALSAELVARLEAPGRTLWNAYGPTETTIAPLLLRLGQPWRGSTPPLGGNLPGISTSQLDANGAVLTSDPAARGELAVGGWAVARGYLGRPAATAERFRPDPEATAPGARRYWTGDLVERLPSGELSFLGRADHQVKVRGVRIELAEVEAALLAQAEIAEAAVTLQRDAQGAPWLIAHVVPRAQLPPATELRARLAAHLAEAALPAVFHELAALPRLPSGKLDRRALPSLDLEARSAGPAPRNETEARLAALWGELLGLPEVGVHDSFFALGGHSLLATRLVARLRSELAVEIPLERFLRSEATIATLARELEAGRAATSAFPPLLPSGERPCYPVAFPQERVWFLDRLRPGSRAYDFNLEIELLGPLAAGALTRALGALVARHEILRSRFPEQEGRPVMVVEPCLPARSLAPLVDLSALPGALAEATATRLMDAEVRRPFRLDRLPLVAWSLFRLGPQRHRLLQREHHLVHDGWSVAVLLRELAELYTAEHRGRAARLTAPVVQYRDFAVWQREQLAASPLFAEQLDYWCRRLVGAPPLTELPLDRPRPRELSHRGEALRCDLPPQLSAALRALAHRHGTTLYTVMASVFAVLLARATGQRDLPFACGIANRRLAEIEGMLGMVVNTVVLRAELAPEASFEALLGDLRREVIAAAAHQDLPFERVVAELAPERNLAANPLFQVMFSFHDSAVPDVDLDGVTGRVTAHHNASSKVDWNVVVVPRGEQRVGRAAAREDDETYLFWEFATDLFDRVTIERFAARYLRLAEAAVEAPATPWATLSWLAPAERAQLAAWAAGPTPTATAPDVPTLVRRQEALRPEAIALVDGAGEHWSYAWLGQRARSVAASLQASGLPLEGRVGLTLERSAARVAALLGVLEAGGAYLPLDLGWPAARLGALAASQELALLLHDDSQRLPAELGDPPRLGLGGALAAPSGSVRGGARVASNQQLAYVPFTSGSTGEPKAVGVPHAAIVRLVEQPSFLPTDAERTFLHLAPLAFDASSLEIWLPLAHGAKLVVAPPGTLGLAELGALLERHRVTDLWLTTSLAQQLAEQQLPAFAGLARFLVGGEAVPAELARRLLSAHPALTLVDGYGPTECTTFSHTHAVRAADLETLRDPIPLGRPIQATYGHVLEPSGAPAPLGVPGELWLGGAGLARGYLGRPGPTAERFRPDPSATEQGARLYATGDRARWLPDGTLEYLGRRDRQLKIRGFRIEPGEIEALLAALAEVAAVAVRAVEDPVAGKRLTAYVVPASPVPEGATPFPERLRTHCLEHLPAYLVPTFFVVLDRLPVTASGKLDAAALPSPRAPEVAAARTVTAPRSGTEEALAALWTELLGVTPIGIDDDFFELGGHSLLATQLLSRLRATFEVELPLAAVFEHPTVAALAAVVEDATGATARKLGLSQAAWAPSPPPTDPQAEVDDLSDADVERLLAQMLATSAPQETV